MAQQALPYGQSDNDPNPANSLPIREAWKRTGEMFSDLYSSLSTITDAGAFEFSGELTDEEKIDAALASALASGDTIVRVPFDFIPYDVTLLTNLAAFTAAGGRLVREGGDNTTYDVRAYGAGGDAVYDDTAAIQTTVTAAASAGALGFFGGRVYFPKGVYKITSTVTISGSYMQLWGEAVHGVTIRFAPTANGACFAFDGGGTSLWNCGISRMRFSSVDTTYTKTMIRVEDVRHFHMEDIVSSQNEWEGANSIGLHTLGREFITVDRCQFYANRPIVVDVNPNFAAISLDMSSFKNLQLTVEDTTHYNMEIRDGVVWTGNRFETCDGAGGLGFVQYLNTLTATSSFGNTFDGIRMEQGVAGSTYSFDLESTSGQIQATRFINCHSDPVQNGIKLRKAFWTKIDTFRHTQAGGDALNIDATCSAIVIENFFYQTGATVTGLTAQNSMAAIGLTSGVSTTYQGFWTRAGIVGGTNNDGEAVLVSGLEARKSNIMRVVLTAARAVGTPLNPTTGQRMVFLFIQDAVGGWAVTWGGAFKVSWSDTGNTANKHSTVAFVYDGTNWKQDGAQSPWI